MQISKDPNDKTELQKKKLIIIWKNHPQNIMEKCKLFNGQSIICMYVLLYMYLICTFFLCWWNLENLCKCAVLELFALQGEQGWHSVEDTHLPTLRPRFKCQPWHHKWVVFVVGSLPCSERFFPGYSNFRVSSKTNLSKFQSDQEW